MLLERLGQRKSPGQIIRVVLAVLFRAFLLGMFHPDANLLIIFVVIQMSRTDVPRHLNLRVGFKLTIHGTVDDKAGQLVHSHFKLNHFSSEFLPNHATRQDI